MACPEGWPLRGLQGNSAVAGLSQRNGQLHGEQGFSPALQIFRVL